MYSTSFQCPINGEMYSTSFQCPINGEWVRARWSSRKGTITIEPMEGAKKEETKNWCVLHSYAKRETWKEADDYIIHVSDGQTFGFERD